MLDYFFILLSLHVSNSVEGLLEKPGKTKTKSAAATELQVLTYFDVMFLNVFVYSARKFQKLKKSWKALKLKAWLVVFILSLLNF